MKDIFINQQNPFLDHLKWNELANTNVLFNKILTSMLGGKYKGIYDENRLYDKYDYIWKDDNLYFVSDKPEFLEFKTVNIDGLEKPTLYGDNKLYALKNKRLVQIIENSENLKSNVVSDDFTFHPDSNTSIVKNGNNLIKVNNNKNYGINLSYQLPIKQMKYDGMYLYLLSENRIIYGEINSTDNTSYNEIEFSYNGCSFDVANKYIAILCDNKKLLIYDKKTKTQLLSINVNTADINKAVISFANDDYLLFYDGQSSIVNYYISDNKSIDVNYIYTSEVTNNIENFSSTNGFISFTKDNKLFYTSNINQIFVKADIRHLMITNSLIKPACLREGIDFTNGQIQSDNFSISNMSNITTKLNKGLLLSESNSSLFIKLNSINEKSFLISFNSLNNKAVNLRFSFHFNGVKFDFEYTQSSSKEKDINILFNFNNNKPEVFINNQSYQGIYSSTSNPNQELIITGNYIELNSVACFTKILQKDEIDYILNNKLSLNAYEMKKLTPHTIVKTDSNGNVLVQTGSVTQKGILKISNDLSSPSEDKAFSTIGAFEQNNRIDQLEDMIRNNVSLSNHKHLFSEIINVPTASLSTNGIVKLSNNINNDTTVAATPSIVKTVYDLANHTHPYLPLNGGVLNGNLECRMLNATDVSFNNLNSKDVTSKNINSDNVKTKQLSVTESVNFSKGIVSDLTSTNIKTHNANVDNLYTKSLKIGDYIIMVVG